jgi:hypothetical protein
MPNVKNFYVENPISPRRQSVENTTCEFFIPSSLKYSFVGFLCFHIVMAVSLWIWEQSIVHFAVTFTLVMAGFYMSSIPYSSNMRVLLVTYFFYLISLILTVVYWDEKTAYNYQIGYIIQSALLLVITSKHWIRHNFSVYFLGAKDKVKVY